MSEVLTTPRVGPGLAPDTEPSPHTAQLPPGAFETDVPARLDDSP